MNKEWQFLRKIHIYFVIDTSVYFSNSYIVTDRKHKRCVIRNINFAIILPLLGKGTIILASMALIWSTNALIVIPKLIALPITYLTLRKGIVVIIS